jgi:hypothetical protein
MNIGRFKMKLYGINMDYMIIEEIYMTNMD